MDTKPVRLSDGPIGDVAMWLAKNTDAGNTHSVFSRDVFVTTGGPIAWVLVGLTRCGSGNNGGGGNGDGGARDATDAQAPDATPDTYVDATVDTSTDPTVRNGFNGNFLTPNYPTNPTDPNDPGVPCPVVDIDLGASDQNKMIFMCKSPVERFGTATVNSADPMKSTQQAHYGAGDSGWIGQQVPGAGEIIPAQIVEVASDTYVVPFNAGSGATMLSGLALIDPAGTVRWNTFPLEVDRSGSDPIAFRPVGFASGLSVGGRILFPATAQPPPPSADGGVPAPDGGTPTTLPPGRGVVLSYGVKSTRFEINPNDSKPQIVLPGNEPTASASLGGSLVAIVVTSGTAGASIVVIDTSATDAAQAVVATIPLGVKAAVKLPELTLGDEFDVGTPADGGLQTKRRYAVVAGAGDPNADGGVDPQEPKKVLIVEITKTGQQVSGTLVGSVVLDAENAKGDVRGIAIVDRKAYITVEDEDAGLTNSSGKVAVVDFTDPSLPTFTGMIYVGHDIGTIAAHRSGTLYVAVTDRWYETPGANPTPWSHIVAINPLIAAIMRPEGGTSHP